MVDSHTAIVPGEGLIATAGLVDSHVHLSSPAVAAAALSAGITTIVGMGTGGVWDVGANPAYNLRALIAGWAGVPLNAAFLARGSSRSAGLLAAAVEAGAGGFKVHEDWGATPEQVDTCLTVAEAAGLPVALHTDTLNESGYLADTVAATAGRTVHAYHVEGGGGHPDILEIVNYPHVLGSSTTPTLPLTPATAAELLPMTMTVHKLRARRQRRGDRGVAGAAARHRGGELPARPRGDPDHQLRLDGHGPDRRGGPPDVAARSRPGGAARGDRARRSRTTSGCCATWPRSR